VNFCLFVFSFKINKSVPFLLENKSAFLVRQKRGSEGWKKVVLFTFRQTVELETGGEPLERPFSIFEVSFA